MDNSQSDGISPFEHPALDDEMRERLAYAFTVAAETNNNSVLMHFFDQDLIKNINKNSVLDWESILNIK